jgi:hypothetical protein
MNALWFLAEENARVTMLQAYLLGHRLFALLFELAQKKLS